jgi:endonuclease VIII
MEGPSLFLAAEQLRPFIGQTIQSVEGNTKIGKERLDHQKIKDIFSWGKHLVFQFDSFALRVHFMLFGTFEAFVNDKSVTGDYPRKNRSPRLLLICKNGRIAMFSCSLKFIENSKANKEYDFKSDIMSDSFDSKEALEKMKDLPQDEIGDVLLDQSIFSGVGNIIKNEVLFLEKLSPETTIAHLTLPKLKKIILTTKKYVFQFYEWRKNFVLRKHYQIYRKSICPRCGEKVIREKTGGRKRMSYYCKKCQARS